MSGILRLNQNPKTEPTKSYTVKTLTFALLALAFATSPVLAQSMPDYPCS